MTSTLLTPNKYGATLDAHDKFIASDASSFVNGAILPMDADNLALNAGGTYPESPPAYA
ncbi:MAG: hypothetical protein HQ477_06165 [Chloroflexi bacterium]|nr:hypothetical protein [Chloroflexota bacterium]